MSRPGLVMAFFAWLVVCSVQGFAVVAPASAETAGTAPSPGVPSSPPVPVAATAATSSVREAAPPLSSGELREDPAEEVVRRIAKDLRCAVCQNQSVYESNSTLAKDMLGLIRDKVTAGESETAIREYFFSRYGDYIYLEPTTRGANAILWLAPFIGLLLGGGILWWAIGRWQRAGNSGDGVRDVSAGPAAAGDPPVDLRDRIRGELNRIDL
ncbi:MAG: cytochrome c-type biogenesis protein CcmH [Magnetococcales bacterium]|nr:cytochrome c-type biogenesis protein CcmH [Magnetococcales bacterium]